MSYLQKVKHPIKFIALFNSERIYETADAARVISCSAHTITDLCKAGDLKFERRGRKYCIKGSELSVLVKRDQAMRAERTAAAIAEAAKQKEAPRQVKEDAIDVGQMDMLDTVPRHYRINISPKVYMRLRKAAREMNITLSDLASMLLAAGLQGREQE